MFQAGLALLNTIAVYAPNNTIVCPSASLPQSFSLSLLHSCYCALFQINGIAVTLRNPNLRPRPSAMLCLVWKSYPSWVLNQYCESKYASLIEPVRNQCNLSLFWIIIICIMLKVSECFQFHHVYILHKKIQNEGRFQRQALFSSWPYFTWKTLTSFHISCSFN